MCKSVQISEAQARAIEILRLSGGCILITMIPDKSEKDCLGILNPGMRVYQSLEKLGLVFFSIEDPVYFTDDPDDPGFWFTSEVCLVDDTSPT